MNARQDGTRRPRDRGSLKGFFMKRLSYHRTCPDAGLRYFRGGLPGWAVRCNGRSQECHFDLQAACK